MAGFRASSCGGLFLLLLISLLIFPDGALATPVLDQLASPNGGSFVQDNDLEPVQSFTVGRTGHLTEIDLWSVDTQTNQVCCDLLISTQFTATADLLSGSPSDGNLHGSIIAQVNLSAASDGPIFQGWNAFVLPTPIPVTAGEVLYFTIVQDDVIDWGTSSYGGGAMAWLCYNDGCADPANPGGPLLEPGAVVLPTSDWAFRTFVPEPGPALLLALGAFATGTRRRRRG